MPRKNSPQRNNLISTKQFAKKYLVQPDTVRRSLCVNGHYCGIVPEKLPNGRLGWPEQEV